MHHQNLFTRIKQTVEAITTVHYFKRADLVILLV